MEKTSFWNRILVILGLKKGLSMQESAKPKTAEAKPKTEFFEPLKELPKLARGLKLGKIGKPQGLKLGKAGMPRPAKVQPKHSKQFARPNWLSELENISKPKATKKKRKSFKRPLRSFFSRAPVSRERERAHFRNAKIAFSKRPMAEPSFPRAFSKRPKAKPKTATFEKNKTVSTLSKPEKIGKRFSFLSRGKKQARRISAKDAIVEGAKTLQAPFASTGAMAQPQSEVQVRSVSEQIADTKELMASLENMYLKRQISEDAYRDKLLQYQQRLKELQLLQKGGQKVSEPKFSTPSVQALIEEKGHEGNVKNEELKKVEQKVSGLMNKYNIPESEISREIQKIDKGNLVEGMDKVIDLIEMEQKTHQMMQQLLDKKGKASEGGMVKGVAEAGMPKKPVKEVKALALEVHKQRIITDFDRILEYVNENKKTGVTQLAKELNMEKQQVAEYAAILSDKHLLELKYPAFGELQLVAKKIENGDD